MLGREVVERQQRIAVLGQAIGGSLVFNLVGFDKGFQGGNGGITGIGPEFCCSFVEYLIDGNPGNVFGNSRIKVPY
jgi:hypothetical protein